MRWVIRLWMRDDNVLAYGEVVQHQLAQVLHRAGIIVAHYRRGEWLECIDLLAPATEVDTRAWAVENARVMSYRGYDAEACPSTEEVKNR